MLRRVIPMMMARAIAPPPFALVWDPADKTADMTLSAGNLTASSNAPGSNQFVRSTFKGLDVPSGLKVCWQIRVDALSGPSRVMAGLSEKDGAIGTANAGTVAHEWNGGSGVSSNGWTETGGGSNPWGVSDTLDGALDCAAGKYFLGR